MAKKSNNNPPEINQDWYPVNPNDKPDKRLKRIMAIQDRKQEELLRQVEIPESIPTPNFSTVYTHMNNLWQVTGFRCLDCGKTMSKPGSIQKHPLVCKQTLKINKEEEQEILARVKSYANKKDTAGILVGWTRSFPNT